MERHVLDWRMASSLDEGGVEGEISDACSVRVGNLWL